MPRGRPKGSKSPLPLAAANDRLLMLEKAGLTKDKLAGVLAKCVAVVESILEDPESDAFARIAAAKMLARDIVAIAPYKGVQAPSGSQAPVIINIGEQPPAPGRKRQAPPAPDDDPQAPVVIDLPHNAP